MIIAIMPSFFDITSMIILFFTQQSPAEVYYTVNKNGAVSIGSQ